jgi:cellulose synthase/poly-beta-1,6-N-acetylglucosamine synthase-like glycosyltransferase
MTVSIIIAVRTWQANLAECVTKCLKLEASGYEILILPDEDCFKEAQHFLRSGIPLKIIPTGNVLPGKKRDIALGHAQGQILAFLDDDAYPAKDWLKNALRYFSDEAVAAVGGPAVTPASDTLLQRASGLVYSSYAMSGSYVYRYVPRRARFVVDYPSCNFLVRAQVMRRIGGFATDFWPGEDTKFCLDISRLGKKIIYAPDVLVYHHRRSLFVPHLKQIASYGLHRGYFVKRYPQTSLRIAYFLPSFFTVMALAGGVFGLLYLPVKLIFLTVTFVYLSLVFIFSVSKELALIPLVFFGIISSHFSYGIYFLKGLLVKRLPEEE